MDVHSAIICDAAYDYGGKLCILGAFDSIAAQSFPTKHPRCAIALRILFREEDRGEHKMRINFVDADGRNVIQGFNPEVPVKIDQIPIETFFISKNFIINLDRLPLSAPGIFSFDILMDDQFVARIPLQILRTQDLPRTSS